MKKAVFITYNQALTERVAFLLDQLQIKGFTQWLSLIHISLTGLHFCIYSHIALVVLRHKVGFDKTRKAARPQEDGSHETNDECFMMQYPTDQSFIT